MEAMKIMIGYDGSSHADAALADLRRAGLPRKVEAMALSVSEEWIPAPVPGKNSIQPYFPCI
jgi:hypothetical protein